MSWEMHFINTKLHVSNKHGKIAWHFHGIFVLITSDTQPFNQDCMENVNEYRIPPECLWKKLQNQLSWKRRARIVGCLRVDLVKVARFIWLGMSVWMRLGDFGVGSLNEHSIGGWISKLRYVDRVNINVLLLQINPVKYCDCPITWL